MSKKEEYRPLSNFAIAFAKEFSSYMKTHGIRQYQLAEALERTQPYVNDRVNGKRALDTDDVDALAKLTGTTGKSLLIELARLTREDLVAEQMDIEERERRTLEKIARHDMTLAAYKDEDMDREAEDFGA